MSHLRTDIQRVEALRSRIDDVQAAVELEDPALIEEATVELPQLAQDIASLEVRTLLAGEYDVREALVTINSGTGGTDAADWAEMLMRMYLRWAERRGYPTEVFDTSYAEEAGIKSATFVVHAPYAYGTLAGEHGVHRLVRISPFDAAKRRQTSFASVYIYPDIDEAIEIEINDKDLRVDTYRSSGAGGQHVNVTDSAIRITHIPTNTVVTCQNERSQHKNRDTAMKLLRAKLYQLEVEKRQAEQKTIEGEKKEISFGSQIRSYVLQPYQMVKDLRTGYEVGEPQRVLDGDLDGFIEAYLADRARKTAD
jgi:peptide chain release factor 2